MSTTNKNFPGGVWPVMITPFTDDNMVDYPALERLVNWYIEQGVSGLFAACQSSEIFFLSLEERVKITETVVRTAAKRVPVIASGHVSDTLEAQADELNAIARTGVDALILITNRLAGQNESDAVWLANMERLLSLLDNNLPLGFYECPYPYKRLMTAETLRRCVTDDRFCFLKDTCCNIEEIRVKLDLLRGSGLKLYNANTSTLLESLRCGAAGYSGVMANFHPKAYVWLCNNIGDSKADSLADWLSIASMIERQCYPVNAKHHLSQLEHLNFSVASRTRNAAELTPVFRQEVAAMERISQKELVKLG